MFKTSTAPAQSMTQLLADVNTAAYQFPFDHNLRRLPAALAVGGVNQIPLPDVLMYLEACEANDPYTKDLQEQLREVRALLNTPRTLQ